MKNKKQRKEEDTVFGININNNVLAVMAIIFLMISIANDTIIILERQKQAQLREPKKLTGEYAIATASLAITEAGCRIPFLDKWNFISLCADAENKSIKKILENISSSYDYLLEWNETAQEFMVYSAKSSNNPFEKFDENKSYFIYINTPAETLDVQGDEYGDVNLSLIEEWNDPFYPYIFDGNVSLYLDELGDDYDYMMRWGNVNQTFYVYARKSVQRPFDFIYRGEGQMIYINNPAGTYLYYNKTKMQNG